MIIYCADAYFSSIWPERRRVSTVSYQKNKNFQKYNIKVLLIIRDASMLLKPAVFSHINGILRCFFFLKIY